MSDNPRGLRHVEHVMGTVFSFDIRDAATPAVERALRDAVALLHHVDALFSTYKPDSAISRLARNATTPDQLPEMVTEVLGLCAEAERRTRGCFSSRPGGRLDPSGLVKGWSVEEASTILYDAGAHNSYVNGGGDLQLRGESAPGVPWCIGIADPLRAGRLFTTVTGRDMAVATSGTTERGCHIIDPRTGAPAGGVLSATVTGRHLTWADAYATAAVVLGPDAHAWIAEVEGYELLTVSEPVPPSVRPGAPR
ncbi:FAD:protein FMN transferase [Streptomyces sp. NPDC023998]|uniref:FAD:protein FMN transferase n=1 Tax=Streptomyces sp. NPDC023998 TaxID=3154597 RepID=UPI0033E5E6A5